MAVTFGRHFSFHYFLQEIYQIETCRRDVSVVIIIEESLHFNVISKVEFTV